LDDGVPAQWLLTVALELVHAASREVSAERWTDQDAERVLLRSVTGALAAPARRARAGRS
jgi:hypothetical protein